MYTKLFAFHFIHWTIIQNHVWNELVHKEQTENKLLNLLYLENIFEILHQQVWLSVNSVGFSGSVESLLIFNTIQKHNKWYCMFINPTVTVLCKDSFYTVCHFICCVVHRLDQSSAVWGDLDEFTGSFKPCHRRCIWTHSSGGMFKGN